MKRAIAIGLLTLLLAGGSGAGIGVPEPACRPRATMACCAAGAAEMTRECCAHKAASHTAAANGGQAQATLKCNCESHAPVGSPARSDDSYTFASASPIPTGSLIGHSVPSPRFSHPQGSIEPTTPPPRA